MSLPCQQILTTPLNTPVVSDTVPLPPLPRSSHLVPVPLVRADSPVRDDPVPAPKDEVEPDDGAEEPFPVDPEESYTDPGMRSDFLLQQEDADEEMAVVPKWFIETLKDSGVTNFTSWNDSGPRTRSRDRSASSSASVLLQTNYSLLSAIMVDKEPVTVEEALSQPMWKAAMEAEIGYIERNATWELVP